MRHREEVEHAKALLREAMGVLHQLPVGPESRIWVGGCKIQEALFWLESTHHMVPMPGYALPCEDKL